MCQFKKKNLFNIAYMVLMVGQSKMKSKLILFNPINVKPLKNPAFTIHHVRVLILKFFKQIKLNLINVAREK